MYNPWGGKTGCLFGHFLTARSSFFVILVFLLVWLSGCSTSPTSISSAVRQVEGTEENGGWNEKEVTAGGSGQTSGLHIALQRACLWNPEHHLPRGRDLRAQSKLHCSKGIRDIGTVYCFTWLFCEISELPFCVLWHISYDFYCISMYMPICTHISIIPLTCFEWCVLYLNHVTSFLNCCSLFSYLATFFSFQTHTCTHHEISHNFPLCLFLSFQLCSIRWFSF